MNKLQLLSRKVMKNSLNKYSKFLNTTFNSEEEYLQFIANRLKLDKKSKVYLFNVNEEKELGATLKKYFNKQIDVQLSSECCIINKQPFIGFSLVITKK